MLKCSQKVSSLDSSGSWKTTFLRLNQGRRRNHSGTRIIHGLQRRLSEAGRDTRGLVTLTIGRTLGQLRRRRQPPLEGKEPSIFGKRQTGYRRTRKDYRRQRNTGRKEIQSRRTFLNSLHLRSMLIRGLKPSSKRQSASGKYTSLHHPRRTQKISQGQSTPNRSMRWIYYRKRRFEKQFRSLARIKLQR